MSGTITLTTEGTAERRVLYARSGGTVSPEYVAVGRFRVFTDGTVDLRLRADSGRAAYAWHRQTTLRSMELRLRHPDPADGPDIIEVYRRQ